jgi:fibronectin type 3 domain-containing protein
MRASRVAWLVTAIVVIGAITGYQHRRRIAHTLHIGAAASVTLRWSPSPGATTYNVYRGAHSGGPYERIAITSIPAYVDYSFSDQATVYYVVTAVGNAKESAYSTEVKAEVP